MSVHPWQFAENAASVAAGYALKGAIGLGVPECGEVLRRGVVTQYVLIATG
jgi:hypothetical protein